MEWITGIIIGVVALAVLGVVFFGSKPRDDRPVPGRFDFDVCKEGEGLQAILPSRIEG